MHQLIILGNGFDLHCGLRSSFTDFYNQRKHDIQNKEGNVWDIILENLCNRNWIDIEKEIADAVLERPNGHSTVGDAFQAATSYLNQCRQKGWADMTCHSPLIQKLAPYITNKFDVIEQGIGYRFFLNELQTYEKEFAAYLTNEIKENRTDYYERASISLGSLINDYVDDDQSSIETSLLNFNYTEPTADAQNDIDIKHVTNIHGKLRTRVIFGIDMQNIPQDSPAIPFTKTYRLLNRESVNDTIVKKANTGDFATSLIKVYGHSLGAADYSYFQSLFDAVNLYDGDTSLVFYYSIYGNRDEHQIKEELFQKITSLLMTYGNTLDNKAHGKNLMHKLLLEQRLAVAELIED